VVAFVIVMSLFLMLVDWALSAVVFQWILGWSK
jgi:preprotein translocase subunit SecE